VSEDEDGPGECPRCGSAYSLSYGFHPADHGLCWPCSAEVLDFALAAITSAIPDLEDYAHACDDGRGYTSLVECRAALSACKQEGERMNKTLTSAEERELHLLDTAHRLGHVSTRALTNCTTILTRLAVQGRLRQIAIGMYRITEDGRGRLADLAGVTCPTCRHRFVANKLTLGAARVECLGHTAPVPTAAPEVIEVTVELPYLGAVPIIRGKLLPGTYRARLEKIS
jgi:DNA-directed RNA polymerase subunit RPC12/RpoP